MFTVFDLDLTFRLSRGLFVGSRREGRAISRTSHARAVRFGSGCGVLRHGSGAESSCVAWCHSPSGRVGYEQELPLDVICLLCECVRTPPINSYGRDGPSKCDRFIRGLGSVLPLRRWRGRAPLSASRLGCDWSPTRRGVGVHLPSSSAMSGTRPNWSSGHAGSTQGNSSSVLAAHSRMSLRCSFNSA